MEDFEFVEKLPCRPDLSLFRVRQSLTNAFLRVDLAGNIEQAPIGLGVLDDRGGLSLHREHYRAPAFLELLQELARTAPKSRQRLDILSNVKHERVLIKAPFQVFLEYRCAGSRGEGVCLCLFKPVC